MIDWQRFDAAAMQQHLADALARPLPGRAAQRPLTHRLAYGRHRGPVPAGARLAAVLVLLEKRSDGWHLPAILRPETMTSHAGQVSLPGGLVEGDETFPQAALRELEEELGIAAEGVQVVGRLSPVYVFVSDIEVTPVVAVASQALAITPNPHEVAAVLDISLAQLADRSSWGAHVIERRGLRFGAPHYLIANQRIWGATSLVLAELIAVLEAFG